MPSVGSGRIGRRKFIGTAAKTVGAFAFYDTFLRPLAQPTLEPTAMAQDRAVRFGTTFSPLKTWYMDMDYRKAFREVLDLDLDFIRLGSYWSEIESKKGEIANFWKLDWLLNEAEKRGCTEVILTIGIKAPVYPEFHFPAWVLAEINVPKVGRVADNQRLREYGLRFVQKVLERYGNADVVKCIQVENEPFDPVVYDFETYRFLGTDFLREEVGLVRREDPRHRPILLNMFMETNPLTAILANIERNPLVRLSKGKIIGGRDRNEAIGLADIVGYDVYPSVGWEVFGRKVYFRPWRDADYNNLVAGREQVEAAGKSAYIIEAQAEPWEPGSVVHIKKRDYPSFDPEAMEKFIDRLFYLGFRDIAFWGVEHWLWHRRACHPEWWDKGVSILSRYR